MSQCAGQGRLAKGSAAFPSKNSPHLTGLSCVQFPPSSLVVAPSCYSIRYRKFDVTSESASAFEVELRITFVRVLVH
ncbi:hypothetical protein R1flu_013884 [Riccia fluitans]|uniref:Uncharacterized protein n=1 Tax=Riccia fluitans TaxID=41844 RepID=A0ABD1YEW2_9MARC